MPPLSQFGIIGKISDFVMICVAQAPCEMRNIIKGGCLNAKSRVRSAVPCAMESIIWAS